MASSKQGESNELKKRFDNFIRAARHDDKPYRMMGRPQIANRQVSVLIAYPAVETEAEKAAFVETLSQQLKEYGLDPAEHMLQKSGVRIQARILVAAAPESESSKS